MDEVPNARRGFQCRTSRVASLLARVGELYYMLRGLSKNMCELTRREIFKQGAVERGDQTFLTIPLFYYNLMLNTKKPNFFSSLPPYALPPALRASTSTTKQICACNKLQEGKLPHLFRSSLVDARSRCCLIRSTLLD
jgi:hypothetical protein